MVDFLVKCRFLHDETNTGASAHVRPHHPYLRMDESFAFRQNEVATQKAGKSLRIGESIYSQPAAAEVNGRNICLIALSVFQAQGDPCSSPETAMTQQGQPLLSVRLSVRYPGRPCILRDAAFEIQPGEILGLVRQSGSGKSTLALAILGLLDMKRGRAEGSIHYCGTLASGSLPSDDG